MYPYDDETVATCFKAMIDALDQSTDKQHLFKFIKDFILVQLCEKEIFDIWMPPNPMEMLKSTLKDGDEVRLGVEIISHLMGLFLYFQT